MEKEKGLEVSRIAYEITSRVVKEHQVDVFDAVCRYAFYGEEPTLPEELQAVFDFLRPLIEESIVDYDAIEAEENASKREEEPECRKG